MKTITILESLARIAIVIILMFLVWNITISNSQQMDVKDWMSVIVLSLMCGVWTQLPLFEEAD